jgi:addiction module HigA family antidote
MSTLEAHHPGSILREEFMEPVGLTSYQLAKALSVPLPRVNDIVLEKRAVSAEMGLLLSAYFGTSEQYWARLQADYDVRVAKARIAAQLQGITPHPRNRRGALTPLEGASSRRGRATRAMRR